MCEGANISLILDVLKGLLTPVIAIITTYIAWEQWKLGHQNLRERLFDRRMALLEAAQEFLADFRSGDEEAIKSLPRFRESVWRSRFLFETTTVPDYLEKVLNEFNRLQITISNKSIATSAEERIRFANDELEIRRWLNSQAFEMYPVFSGEIRPFS